MITAVACENGAVCQHFGRAPTFLIVESEGRDVKRTSLVEVSVSGHAARCGMLHRITAETVICGGLGRPAAETLASLGIRLCAGVTGDALKAAEALLEGRLKSDDAAIREVCGCGCGDAKQT